MKFEIVAIGSMKTAGLGDALDEYVGRIGRYVQAEVVEVDPGSSSREAERKRQEAEALLSAAPDTGTRIAVDQRGRTVTSEQFADWVDREMVSGTRYVTFFIGGAFGLDADFRKNDCHWSLSLSSLTLPHELARVALAEQLYRALTIVRGEPYHK